MAISFKTRVKFIRNALRKRADLKIIEVFIAAVIGQRHLTLCTNLIDIHGF